MKGRDTLLRAVSPDELTLQASVFVEAVAHRQQNPWPFLGFDNPELIELNDRARVQRDQDLAEQFINAAPIN